MKFNPCPYNLLLLIFIDNRLHHRVNLVPYNHSMRIIFFGSDPWYSPPVLEALLNAGHDIPFIVTKGKTLKKFKGSEIQRFRNSVDLLALTKLSTFPDVIILASYGPPFLTDKLLNWPKYGALNLHASLLPRWRGASPVTAAIAAGDPETGVTVMRMTKEIDRGPILTQAKIRIRQPDLIISEHSENSDYDTRETLTRRLGKLAGELIVKVLQKLEKGQITEMPQPLKSPTPYTRRLTKESGQIDWSKSPTEIERFIRSVTPQPAARNTARWRVAGSGWQKIEIKILKAHIGRLPTTSYPPRAELIIDEVQLPGKNPVSWKQFLAGHPQAKFY